MKFKLFLIPLALFFSYIVVAMEERGKKVKTIDDVAEYYAKITEQAFMQPSIETTMGGYFEKYKLLSLDDHDDCWGCLHFSKNMNKALHNNDFSISHFGINGADSYDKMRLQGIILYLNNNSSESYPFKIIKDRYSAIIKLLQNGWKPTPIKSTPHIGINLTEFNFFIKKRELAEEDSFLRFILNIFNFDSNAVNCPVIGRFNDPNELHLWVKKDKQAEFDAIFRFNYITQNDPDADRKQENL